MKPIIIILAIALTTLACCKKKTTTDTNYFSCNINGTPYYMNKAYTFNSVTCSEGNSIEVNSFLNIFSYKCTDFDFHFYINNAKQGMIYELKSGSNNNNNVLLLSPYPSGGYTTSDNFPSTITLTNFTDHLVAGTFTCNIYENGNVKFAITDGKFHIPY